MIQHSFIPKIVRPTRIKKQSATLIDHIFTRDNLNCITSGIINTEIAGNCGYTDHFPIFIILATQRPKVKNKATYEKSYFTDQDNEDRKVRLKNEDWTPLYALDDANEIYSFITEKYSKHYHETKTTKVFKNRSNQFKQEPWMTPEILASIRKRDRLAKLKHRRQDYKELRNRIVSEIRKAEKAFIRTQVEENVGNIKKHWDIIRKVSNKTNNKEDMITSFIHNGAQINDPMTNAENINNYYANVGKETNESVGVSINSAETYLAKHS